MAKVRVIAALGLLGAVLGSASMWFQHRAIADEAPVNEPSALAMAETRKSVQSRGSSETQDVVSRLFQSGPAPRVIVQLSGGAVDVRARPGDTVNAQVTRQGIPMRFGQTQSPEQVRASMNNIDMAFHQDGNTIQITARRMRPDPKLECITSAAVEVPEAAAVEVRTSCGRVSIAGTKSLLDVQTSNGDIDVQASLAPGSHSFRTYNGNIRLALPAAAVFHVDARTINGSILDQFHIRPEQGSSRTRLLGALGNDPAIDIRLQTANGNITLAVQESPAH